METKQVVLDPSTLKQGELICTWFLKNLIIGLADDPVY